MKDRRAAEDGGWVPVNAHTTELATLGYSVGGYIDKGMPRYVLYRIDGKQIERIHEFDTPEELNNMVKLLLPPNHES